MRRNGFTFVEFVVVLIIIGILAAILFPALQHPHEGSPRRESCMSNLKQIGLAMLQYSQDHDAKFPLVNNAHIGFWTGSTQPYLRSWSPFQCPSAKGSKPKTTDYFYNSHVAALDLNEVPSPFRIVLVGEGQDDSPLNYSLSNLPAVWALEESSPLHRHVDGANYLFADGHVKWLSPHQIDDESKKYHFAVR